MKLILSIFFITLLAWSCNKEPDEQDSCCDLPSSQSFKIAYVDRDTNNLVLFPSNTSYSIDDIELKVSDTNLVKLDKRKNWPKDSVTEMYIVVTLDGLRSLPHKFSLRLNKQRFENIEISGTVPNLDFIVNGNPVKPCLSCTGTAYYAYLFFE